MPRIALGCGNFGGIGSAPEFFGQGLTEDEAFALMDAAWELGITHFDTADAYGGGRSEQRDRPLDRARAACARADDEDVQPDGRRAPTTACAPERIARQLRVEPRAARRRPRRPLPRPRVRPGRAARARRSARSTRCAGRGPDPRLRRQQLRRARSCDAALARRVAATRSRTRYSLLERGDEAERAAAVRRDAASPTSRSARSPAAG